MKLRTAWAPLIVILGSVTPLVADEVQLVNGDQLSGGVVLLNDKELKLKSEILGELTIPREKVSALFLGDARPAPRAARPAEPSEPVTKAATTPEELFQKLTSGKRPAAASLSPEDLVKQLQQGGIGADALTEQAQKSFPLLAAPEAQKYFNDTVGGLMSGKLTIQDVRKEAAKARDGILELQKDLGDDGNALNGYLSILNGFLDETTPKTPKAKTPPKPAPTPEVTPKAP